MYIIYVWMYIVYGRARADATTTWQLVLQQGVPGLTPGRIQMVWMRITKRISHAFDASPPAMPATTIFATAATQTQIYVPWESIRYGVQSPTCRPSIRYCSIRCCGNRYYGIRHCGIMYCGSRYCGIRYYIFCNILSGFRFGISRWQSVLLRFRLCCCRIGRRRYAPNLDSFSSGLVRNLPNPPPWNDQQGSCARDPSRRHEALELAIVSAAHCLVPASRDSFGHRASAMVFPQPPVQPFCNLAAPSLTEYVAERRLLVKHSSVPPSGKPVQTQTELVKEFGCAYNLSPKRLCPVGLQPWD